MRCNYSLPCLKKQPDKKRVIHALPTRAFRHSVGERWLLLYWARLPLACLNKCGHIYSFVLRALPHTPSWCASVPSQVVSTHSCFSHRQSHLQVCWLSQARGLQSLPLLKPHFSLACKESIWQVIGWLFFLFKSWVQNKFEVGVCTVYTDHPSYQIYGFLFRNSLTSMRFWGEGKAFPDFA